MRRLAPKWLVVVIVIGVLVCVLAIWWLSTSSYFEMAWDEVSLDLSLLRPFAVVLGLLAVVLVGLAVLCFSRTIWPLSQPAHDQSVEYWGAQCQAIGARATALALVLGVIGGGLGFMSLKAALLPFEPTPESIRAEGAIELVRDALEQSSANIRIRSIGNGRARVTAVALFVQLDGRSETELLTHPVDILMKGNTVKPVPSEPLQRILGPKLRDAFILADLKAIRSVKAEPRYEDMFGRPRTPREGNRYALEIRKK